MGFDLTLTNLFMHVSAIIGELCLFGYEADLVI